MSERITAEQVQSDVESYALRASPDGRRRVIREALDKARREGGEDAEAEVARLREALDRDRTGLAHALAAIVAEVRGRAWVAESRGPYKWDDDRYKAEAGAALRKVHRLAEDALRASGAIVGETLTSTKHDAAKGAGR